VQHEDAASHHQTQQYHEAFSHPLAGQRSLPGSNFSGPLPSYYIRTGKEIGTGACEKIDFADFAIMSFQ
jgi:hypothetical protein